MPGSADFNDFKDGVRENDRIVLHLMGNARYVRKKKKKKKKECPQITHLMPVCCISADVVFKLLYAAQLPSLILVSR